MMKRKPRISFHIQFNKEEFEEEAAEILEDARNKIVALVYKHTSVKEKKYYRDEEWFEK